MIKRYRILILFLLLLFIKENCFAQFFLNGDFEINTSAACNFNMANTTWDAQMGSSNAYGLGSELDIMDGTCTYGSPQSGNWFVALAAPSGNTDAFTMTLSAPLVAGTSYSMQFYDKGDFTYTPAIPIVIGVSTVAGALGTVVYTGPVPTAGVWNLRNFTFTAPNNGQYISVSTTGVPRWTHVDNFSFTNTTTNTVTTDTILNYQFCACDTLSVPFTSSGVFLAGNVYTVQLSDATGSFSSPVNIGTLTSTANAGSILCTIPCNAPSGSLYRVRVFSSLPWVMGNDNGIDITINAAPPVTVNSISVCAGQTANLIAIGAVSYTWSTGATSTGVNTADATPSLTTSYTVTGTASGCSANAIATVTVNPTPIVIVNSPSICVGQIATITANGATVYTWSAGAIPNSFNSALASPTVTTTYTVIGNTNGCSDTTTATVSVFPMPTVIVNSPTICAGQTATLTANGAISYTWSAGATSTGINTATATPSLTTTYTVTGTNICTASVTFTVTVNPLPMPTFTSNIATGCVPTCINFTETGTTNCVATTYTFGDGSSSTSSAPTHCYISSGLYSVAIYCTDANSCFGSTTISNMINIAPTPVADFTITPAGIIQPNTVVSFTNTSSGATNQSWNFDDVSSGINNSSSLISPTHTFTNEGNYCIRLIETNSQGCSDTISKCLEVNNKPVVIIPNVFSPNGDNVNDIFTITTISVRELDCTIYDRWGIEMAEWNTLNGGWDGRTKSGTNAVDGVYYYILKTTGIDGTETQQTGFLSLVK